MLIQRNVSKQLKQETSYINLVMDIILKQLGPITCKSRILE